MNMKKIIALLLTLAMVLGLTACGAKDAPAAASVPEEEKESVLVYGSGDYDSINPIMNEHCEIKHLLFDSLVKLDKNGDPVASLAASLSPAWRKAGLMTMPPLPIPLSSAAMSSGTMAKLSPQTMSSSPSKPS